MIVIEQAINRSIAQLEQMNKEENTFLNAHILILKDEILLEEIKGFLSMKYRAKEAIDKAFSKYIDELENCHDEYLEQRALDFIDVKNRLINNLSSSNISLENIGSVILVVPYLYPSMVYSIDKNVKGIIVKEIGLKSHSAILCKEKKIPLVIADIPDDFDGYIEINKDKIILNPEITKKNIALKEKGIEILANINKEKTEIPAEIKEIGLLRSEYLLDSANLEDVNKQKEKFLEEFNYYKVSNINVRTFDIGTEKIFKLLPLNNGKVETYTIYKNIFNNHIEAILEAKKAYSGNITIMFPMIERIEEYHELKREIIKISRRLHVKVPKVGITLETEKALSNLETFKGVDYILIGLGDLTKELFNLNGEEVLLYRDQYLGLLEAVKRVLSFGKRNKIKVSVGGAICDKKEVALKLLEIGAKSLVINPDKKDEIYEAINEF